MTTPLPKRTVCSTRHRRNPGLYLNGQALMAFVSTLVDMNVSRDRGNEQGEIRRLLSREHGETRSVRLRPGSTTQGGGRLSQRRELEARRRIHGDRERQE